MSAPLADKIHMATPVYKFLAGDAALHYNPF